MARTYFALFPGVVPPQAFKAHVAPELLTIGDVWNAARKSPPSLILRVRSESDPGAAVSAEDRLESCVGVVDAATRWRTVWAMARPMINTIRHSQLRAACGEAMQYTSSQHPANVTVAARNQIIETLLNPSIPEGQPQPSTFDRHVALGVAALVSADNDIEAAHYIPFTAVLNPFTPDEQRMEYQGREATIETMSGAVLLSEAANRLGERAPQWIAAVPPALELSPERQQATTKDRSVED